MKTFTVGTIFAAVLFITPSSTQAAALTATQANSLIAVVQSAPGVPASAFVDLITSFSNITVKQATSLIVVVQSAPTASPSAFVDLLISFTADTSAYQTEARTTSQSVSVPLWLTVSTRPSTVAAGQSAVISWSSNSDSYCQVFGGKADTNGSLTTDPLYSTTQYPVTCYRSDGTSVTKFVEVVVNQTPTAAPTLTYSASPATITAGQSSVLSWSATNAYYCTDGGKADVSGSVSTGALYATKVFTMTCPGASGSVTKSVTVTVLPSLDVSVSPSTVAAGQSATLSWNSSANGYCVVFGGKADTNGSLTTDSLYSTTQYTVSCRNTDGTSVEKSQTVTVQ